MMTGTHGDDEGPFRGGRHDAQSRDMLQVKETSDDEWEAVPGGVRTREEVARN